MNNVVTKTDTVLTFPILKEYLIDAPELNKYGAVVAVRTNRELATELLLNNTHLIKNGQVRYFQIKDIGLGVYEVKLREAGKVNTFMVTEWEAQIVNNNRVF